MFKYKLFLNDSVNKENIDRIELIFLNVMILIFSHLLNDGIIAKVPHLEQKSNEQ